MKREILKARGRAFWIFGLGFFLGLELMLRIKLGSIYVMAAGWAFAHQWLMASLGEPDAEKDQAWRLMFALFSALVICAAIFLVFSAANILLRSIDNDWRWFQLP